MKKYRFNNKKLNMGIPHPVVIITAKTIEEAQKRFDCLKLDGHYVTEEPYDTRFDAVKRTGKNDIVTTNNHYSVYGNTIRQSLPTRPSAKRGNR